ncbi:fimbrial protein [Edwardsiella piscicida]|uniref:F4 family fimbrial subunit n=1 Tax=Edwardsiella piscicida TaxID=1263550 RepID=UPI00054CC943|nr:fimbrial protein [Edwardsiella piscicida]
MTKTILLLLAASLAPSCVLAWSTPGDPFSGELRLGGTVTNTRNPWVWKIGEGVEGLDVTLSSRARRGETAVPLSLSAVTLLLGKTTRIVPAGREGLSPRVTYGKAQEDVRLAWGAPGTASVTLPVIGEAGLRVGSFTFQMQAAAVMRRAERGNATYVGLYEDRQGNGLPAQAAMMPAAQIPGTLQAMFGAEGPRWLQDISVSETAGLSRFSDANLHQLEGVYGAQVVPGSGELRLTGAAPSRWRVSLAVSIEYQ